MSQIKQLLPHKKQGFSNRKTAGIVGMDKETMNNYVRKAKADPLGYDVLQPQLDTTQFEFPLSYHIPDLLPLRPQNDGL